MNIFVPAAVLSLLAVPVAAQTPAQTPAPTSAPSQEATPSSSPSAADLTRALNGGPPSVTPTPMPKPAAVTTPAPAATAAPVPATLSTPAPTMAPSAPTGGAPSAPTPVRPPSARATAQPNPTPPPSATAAPVPATLSRPAPTTPPESPTSAPTAPIHRALDADARAALPFRLDLPEGFEIDTGRPGPDFTVYSVRHDGVPYVMIYAGPASQFPIYDGQMAEVAGRASIVVTEAGERHALEHLFQRESAPREIHVWVTSVAGPDRILAERIAQSVDLR